MTSRNLARRARPYVVVNMAMTADGKIATANRTISSFSSRRDHDKLLRLRATADAVMAGARTVDSAKVNLGPGPAKFRRQRLQSGLSEYNLRVVVSRNGSLSPGAEIFKHPFSPIIVLTSGCADERKLARLREVADVVKVCGKNEINLPQALRWLNRKWGVRRLICEGGGELNDALFRTGLVDELHVTVCPVIFGGRNAPTIADGTGVEKLAAALPLKLKSLRRAGQELYLVFQAG